MGHLGDVPPPPGLAGAPSKIGRDGSPQPSDSFARPAPVGAKSWGTSAMCPHLLVTLVRRPKSVGMARRSRPTHSPGPRQSARNHGGTPAVRPHQALPRHLLHWLRLSLRTCEIIRKSRARAEKAGWQGAREGASPLRAVTERATPPDGLFCSRPKGCVSFWLGLRCSGRAADRRETACRRQPGGRCEASATRCGYCRRLRALAKPKILSNAAFS